ncbi:hypothetical protein J437_LFUL013462, partial [Ladona fulva]
MGGKSLHKQQGCWKKIPSGNAPREKVERSLLAYKSEIGLLAYLARMNSKHEGASDTRTTTMTIPGSNFGDREGTLRRYKEVGRTEIFDSSCLPSFEEVALIGWIYAITEDQESARTKEKRGEKVKPCVCASWESKGSSVRWKKVFSFRNAKQINSKRSPSRRSAVPSPEIGSGCLFSSRPREDFEWRKTGKFKGSVGQGPPVHALSMPPGMTCPGYDDSWKKPTAKADCPPSPYRSIDGTCNNLVHADWGVTMRPFRRMLPPDYADGVSEPRVAADGSPLPSARDVSLTVHRPIYRNDPNFTVMLAVWGQFFDHDITATALSKGKDGAPIACCSEDGTLPPKQVHPECYPVVLSAEDPYYSDFNMTCMEFIRSAPAPVCNFGPREQMNQITSFIDASVVYGAVEEQAKRLRNPNGKGELLMMMTPDGRELLPPSTDPRDG